MIHCFLVDCHRYWNRPFSSALAYIISINLSAAKYALYCGIVTTRIQLNGFSKETFVSMQDFLSPFPSQKNFLLLIFLVNVVLSNTKKVLLIFDFRNKKYLLLFVPLDYAFSFCFKSAKNAFVSLITTGLNNNNPIKFGNAIKAFVMSANVQIACKDRYGAAAIQII